MPPAAVSKDVRNVNMVLIGIAERAPLVAKHGKSVAMRITTVNDGDWQANLGGSNEGFDLDSGGFERETDLVVQWQRLHTLGCGFGRGNAPLAGVVHETQNFLGLVAATFTKVASELDKGFEHPWAIVFRVCDGEHGWIE